MDQLNDAFESLADALEAARPGEPETVLPVVERLTLLNRLLKENPVASEEHPMVRHSIDQAMLAVSALMNDMVNERDEVGQAIDRLRSVRSHARSGPMTSLGGPGDGSRLDLRL